MLCPLIGLQLPDWQDARFSFNATMAKAAAASGASLSLPTSMGRGCLAKKAITITHPSGHSPARRSDARVEVGEEGRATEEGGKGS